MLLKNRSAPMLGEAIWVDGGIMNLVNASGGQINDYGQRQVVVKTAQYF